jgi:hypothetical protein
VTSEPHAGTLVDRTTDRPEDADELPRLYLSGDEYTDLELIGTGAYSPLDVFLTRGDFDRVVDEERLSDGMREYVRGYVEENEVPYNPLHDEGYLSIGDEPLTSPIDEDQDRRAGRWSDSDKTECGLHSDGGGR